MIDEIRCHLLHVELSPQHDGWSFQVASQFPANKTSISVFSLSWDPSTSSHDGQKFLLSDTQLARAVGGQPAVDEQLELLKGYYRDGCNSGVCWCKYVPHFTFRKAFSPGYCTRHCKDIHIVPLNNSLSIIYWRGLRKVLPRVSSERIIVLDISVPLRVHTFLDSFQPLLIPTSVPMW